MNNDNQNFNPTSKPMVEPSTDRVHQLGSRAADMPGDKTDHMIGATKNTTADADKSIQGGLGQSGEAAPDKLSVAARQAEEMARLGIEKARAARQSVVTQAAQMRDQTVSYVREEPTKAMLMAMAAGAVATLVVGWATRSNDRSRY